VTFGIVPDSPHTGYGYIQRGDALEGTTARRVARFVEKPDAATAQEIPGRRRLLLEQRHVPVLGAPVRRGTGTAAPGHAGGLPARAGGGEHDLDFCRLDKAAFADCPSDSIDYAVMERTPNAAVVPAEIGWNDIGAWSALWDVGLKDADDNVVRGDVYLDGVKGSYVRAESRMVAALGVENLLIVETPDAVLVADKSKAQDVKKVVDYLKKAGRSEHEFHTRVFRPWGWYEGIDMGERFQVKRIMVKPGHKLSLQMHHHRAEHWVVVSGTARVTRDGWRSC
jgi:mannose-1-phosphate guanylyltransferase/mannose-6-phosphate isomerase